MLNINQPIFVSGWIPASYIFLIYYIIGNRWMYILNLKLENMSEYSATNITQSILPSDDKKYPLKENSTINWNRDMLMRYFEDVKKMKGARGGSQILPSSPETFSLS